MAFPITADVLADTLDGNNLLVTKRTHNRILRDVNRAILFWHQRTNLPFHFKPEAFTRYSGTFVARDPNYVAHRTKSGKPRRGPKPQPPNVKSGRLRRRALRGTAVRVTATKDRATMRFRLPFFKSGRFRPAKSGTFKQIAARQRVKQRIAEMEVINDEELRAMRAEYKRMYLERANQNRRQRKRLPKK